MNILITSVGRRSYLVKYFKEAIGEKGEVHVSNSTNISPAFRYADYSIVSPLIYDVGYIDFLKEYCVKKKINAIISLFDVDLPILAKHKKEFANMGVEVIVSESAVVEICNDKWKTFQFLKKNGFYTPKTYLNLVDVLKEIEQGNLLYPLVLKPRWGMGSISVYTAEEEEELKILYKKIEQQIQSSYLKYESKKTKGRNVIIQETVNGKEYGMDVINDLNGNYQNSIVKEKYAMRAGETDCAITVENKKIEECGETLSKCLKHIGNLDVDVFYDGNQPVVLEMNARFGGGYPFSHVAGVDLPRAIVAWLNGDEAEREWLQARSGVIAHKDIQILEM